MAIFLGSLNRSALRAAAQPPADDPVVDEPVTDPDWGTPPAGYTSVFFDDFAAPVTGTVNGLQSWQGIDRSKWVVADARTGNPDGSGANPTKWPFRSSLAQVPASGMLYMYGGRRPEASASDNTIEETERAQCAVSMRQQLVYPRANPVIVRTRQPWEQRKGYIYSPWFFGRRRTINANGKSHQIGWEIDIETQGGEYDPINRTFRSHFNFHQWQWQGNHWKSQKNPLRVDIPLPDNPQADFTIELRWARGSDFLDPYQTYCEYWIEDPSSGELIRRYHHSPRNFLEAHRGDGRVFPDGPPVPKDPLPPELASVAGKPKINPNVHTQSPYNQYNKMYVPWLYYDAGWTWLDHMEKSWGPETPGHLIYWNGFARNAYFLADSGAFDVRDYSDHYSHIDDHKCFASPVRGVAVFEPE